MTTDRHDSNGFILRLQPPELRERLDEVLGPRNRSRAISRLVAAFLDGRPMPTADELLAKPDKPGGDDGA